MSIELPKIYNAGEVEDRIYEAWEKKGFFNPDKLKARVKKTFSVALPPPNATGILHLGHALMLSYQDTVVRFHRMLGEKTLWLPGEDHAALATNAKVEAELAKEGKTKYDLGRSLFLHRVNTFVMNSRNTIRNQLKKMGSSLDWSRERYTMDDGLTKAVRTMFVKMYNDGLIYRGNRIVNWCVHCESTISDDEVIYKKEKTRLYFIKYGPFTIATVRPETKFGDTALAVNPKDDRYRRYVGKIIDAEDVLGPIKLKVVADLAVDINFGTGVVKVTPAHDFVDFEIGKRHNLEVRQVIEKTGILNEKAGKYSGMKTDEARLKVVSDLKSKKLLIREEEHEHQIAACSRCEGVIEPLVSLQWFVAVDKKLNIRGNKYFKNASLKDVGRKVVKQGEITIIPERFENQYNDWMNNLHDWCISRQIWFGHRIPVWYREVKSEKFPPKADQPLAEKVKSDGKEIYVGVESPKGDGWEQDPDTLDTWFSAGLWTFSTLGWPDKTKDLKTFHPTTFMETGYDIIFTWIARMILMSTYALGEIPFRYVYFHGIVRDKEGRKMSKSLGNGIDPIDMIKKYGADALRLSMIVGGSPGNDSRLYEEKIAGFRNFVNKLWNIARFILITAENPRIVEKEPKAKTLSDEWILSRVNEITRSVTDDLENFRFAKAADDLRHFTWDDLADWYLEVSKIEGKKDDILLYILTRLLIIWHPFAPFVTEAIWERLSSGASILMIHPWPKKKKKEVPKPSLLTWALIQNIVTSIRNLKSFYNIPPNVILALYLPGVTEKSPIVKEKTLIEALARVSIVLGVLKKAPSASLRFAVSSGGKMITAYLAVSGVLDIVKEKERLERELSNLTTYHESLNNKLTNKEFLKRAPKEVILREEERMRETEMKIGEYKEQLSHIA